jgi:hypothetical protein
MQGALSEGDNAGQQLDHRGIVPTLLLPPDLR